MAAPYVCPLGPATRAHPVPLRVQGLRVPTDPWPLIAPRCKSLRLPVPRFSPTKKLGAGGTAIPVALFAHASHPGDVLRAPANPACGSACKPGSWSRSQTLLEVLLAVPTGSPAGSPPCRAGRALAGGSPSSGSPCPPEHWGGLHSSAPLLTRSCRCSSLASATDGSGITYQLVWPAH